MKNATLEFASRLEPNASPAGDPMSNPPARDPYLEILTAEDPAPLVHRLRAEDPVHYVPALGFWFVTRHDDVKRLYHDPENATPDRRVWERFEPRPDENAHEAVFQWELRKNVLFEATGGERGGGGDLLWRKRW